MNSGRANQSLARGLNEGPLAEASGPIHAAPPPAPRHLPAATHTLHPTPAATGPALEPRWPHQTRLLAIAVRSSDKGSRDARRRQHGTRKRSLHSTVSPFPLLANVGKVFRPGPAARQSWTRILERTQNPSQGRAWQSGGAVQDMMVDGACTSLPVLEGLRTL